MLPDYPSGRAVDVVTVGDCCVDLILSGDDVTPQFGQVEKLVGDYALELGGSTCLFAAQAARLGLRAAVVGAVGDDLFGRFVRDRLASLDVDVTFLRIDPGVRTGLGVALDRRGDRAILTYLGSIDAVTEPDVPDDLLAAARHLHLGSYYLMHRLRTGLPRLVQRAKRHGLTVSLDPNWDPAERWNGGLLGLLPTVDLFLPNQAELISIAARAAATPVRDAREALQSLSGLAHRVAVKRGAEGAWLWQRAEHDAGASPVVHKGAGLDCHPPPWPAHEFTDTIGAGDAFDAAMVYALLYRWPDETALRAACAAARTVARARGGLTGQLDATSLHALLATDALTWPTTSLAVP